MCSRLATWPRNGPSSLRLIVCHKIIITCHAYMHSMSGESAPAQPPATAPAPATATGETSVWARYLALSCSAASMGFSLSAALAMYEMHWTIVGEAYQRISCGSLRNSHSISRTGGLREQHRLNHNETANLIKVLAAKTWKRYEHLKRKQNANGTCGTDIKILQIILETKMKRILKQKLE